MVPFEAIGMPASMLHPVYFAIALAMVTYLHVVFGEMVPKNIALAGPERIALVLAPMLRGGGTVRRPALRTFNGIGHLVLRTVATTPKSEVQNVLSRIA